MRKNTALIQGLFALIMMGFITSCTTDADPKLDVFEGVRLYDENGAPIGCYGDCGDDWGEIALSSDELDLLNFSDLITVPGSTGNFNIQGPRPFPMPLSTSGGMFMQLGSDQPAKFKMSIVTTDGNVRAFFATLVDTSSLSIAFDNAFFADVPRGEIVRMYYAYYDDNDNPVYTGYGDMGICPFDPPITNYEGCFE